MAGSSIVTFSLSIKNRAKIDDIKEIRIGPFAHEHIQFDLSKRNVSSSSQANTVPEDTYIKFTSVLKPSEVVEINVPAVVRDSVRLGEVSACSCGHDSFVFLQKCTHASLNMPF